MSYLQELKDTLQRPDIPWKSIITLISLGQFTFETYLTYRQYKVLASKQLPEVLSNDVDEKTFKSSNEYAKAKAKFSVISSTIGLAQNLIVINFDLLPKLWNFGSRVLPSLISPNYKVTSTVMESLCFFGISTVSSTIVSLPVDYYQNFVLEEKFGFNKLSISLWLKDTVKGVALSLGIGSPLLYGFLKIFQMFKTDFIWYICPFLFLIQILAMILVPMYILPLFNKFTPLEDGELKTSIETLAKSVYFPLDKVFVVDGSTRSSHSNAYFTGLPFTSKRIVLYDTLVNESTTEEITAVLAHELGHWKKNHISRMLAISQLHIFAIFSLFSNVLYNKGIYDAFKFSVGSSKQSSIVTTADFPVLIGFIIFNDLLTPMECAMQFFMNLLSRHHEFEADEYGKNLGYSVPLSKALINLQIKNLSTMNVDSLYSSYYYSHPTLPERLEALSEKNSKKTQ